ncbi:MAG: hypothetical protein PVH74_17225 [Desulfobacterales bacterium]
MMDGILLIFIIFALIAGIIGFALKVIFWGWVVKSTVDYWSAFSKNYRQMQSVIDQASQVRSNKIPHHIHNQFSSAMWKAQNDLSHLDHLRRQRGELMMADMKAQAASVGIFVDG